MDGVEAITAAGRTVALVIRSGATSETTTFTTPSDANFQLGWVVYPAGGEVQPHVHLPVVREITGTAEFLLVRSGRCQVDFYSDDRNLVATRELVAGDAVLSLGGGHGFRMTEDTVLLEVKQGPFLATPEKERFPRHAAVGDH